MNLELMQGFLDPSNEALRSEAYEYFKKLKESDEGWKLCINLLTNGSQQDLPVKFFCFQVIGDFVKAKYQNADNSQRQFLRDFVSHWIQYQSSSAVPDITLIQKKAAQIICFVFLSDYPSKWPTFFEDLISTLNRGRVATVIYLRILLTINTDIADREIPRTDKELETFTFIKDTMRDNCVGKLVDTWYQILVTYQSTDTDIVCLCLEVVGSFISWIDIGLIANDRFVQLFVSYLNNPSLREETCDCISQVISKGMEPVAKVKLVELFASLLAQAGVLNLTGLKEDEEFAVKLANLVNNIGTTLLQSWTKLHKSKATEGMNIAASAIHNKRELLLTFLGNDYDDVSIAVIEFAREYLQFLKNKAGIGAYNNDDLVTAQNILFIVINKYKYDIGTDFAHEEDVTSFQEYRKSLKVIFDNLILLDLQLVFTRTRVVITNTLSQWRGLSYNDIEVAITFLYLLGEAIPNCVSNNNPATDKKAEMNDMLHLLVTSGVSRQGHAAVLVQFFETVVRFDKFFCQEPHHIPEILAAFLDDRGLRNSDPHVRSRCSYLFSRFIKSLKSQMPSYSEDILKQMQDLLVLDAPMNGMSSSIVSADDQLFLYETAAILIVSGNFNPPTKQSILKSLLLPVVEKFEMLLQKLPVTSDEAQRKEMAKCMNHAIAVTSRTSKAFSNQQTMKSNGCVEVYSQALQVFLRALNLPYEQAVLQSAVRQYLHRMVVCLESDVLPYFPVAAEQLLKTTDIRSIQEFIPLINQVITKFKKDIVPFVQQIFMPFVTAIFNALSVPIDENDHPARTERQLLQRHYYVFIAVIVSNNITEVIATQSMQDVEQILLSVIQGAVNFPDPVAQKSCFSILKKMVELWGGGDNAGFVEFMYHHIVPACFMAPLKDTFDLNDAQTILALSESASCLKSVLDKRGAELITYLKTNYLPTLSLSPEKIEEYCQALVSDPKAFKNYLKFFFQKART